jgi:hypothetical protein
MTWLFLWTSLSMHLIGRKRKIQPTIHGPRNSRLTKTAYLKVQPTQPFRNEYGKNHYCQCLRSAPTSKFVCVSKLEWCAKWTWRCILVRTECPYVQWVLLFVLLCTKVLAVGVTSTSREGGAPRSLMCRFWVLVAVCSDESISSSLFVEAPRWGPCLPFYSLEGEGAGYSLW